MGMRTKQVNAIFNCLIERNNLIYAPIVQKARNILIVDPKLTAPDQFLSNACRYASWIIIINTAIDEVVERANELSR